MRTQIRLVLLCVPLLLLAACGSTTATIPSPTATQPTTPSPTATQLMLPSPTATQSTQTPAAGFTVYTSSNHTYSISYPTGWQAQTADGNPGKITFTGPNNQEFDITDHYGTSGGGQQQLATEVCQTMADPGKPQTPGPVIGTIVELGGQSWFKASCSADAQPSTVLIVEVVTYKGANYVIDYTSPGASFNADDTTYYEPMQQSFQFLT